MVRNRSLQSTMRLPVREIVAAIDGAAARWSDASFSPRVRAGTAVSERTGYSRPVVEYALDRLFGSLTGDAIEAVIVDELGSLDVLDAFTGQRGRPRAHALPIGRVCVISSRTTIGVALVPAIFALCAKCSVLVKDREDHLVTAFFETLVQQCGELRPALAAENWSGEREVGRLAEFDAVVAFGSDAALAQISAALPFATRLIPFGSRASAGYVTAAALESERSAQAVATGAARDLALYDSEGCLSLHALFVERGGAVSPGRLGEFLASALDRAAVELPIGRRSPEPAARVAMARDLATFRASTGRVYTDAAGSYLLVVEPPDDEPPLFLPRTLGLCPVDAPADAVSFLNRHHIAIEALAVAGPATEIREIACALRAARIANFGALQAPPLGGFHGGRPRIAEFVRWISDET